jgi:hypothetical protein
MLEYASVEVTDGSKLLQVLDGDVEAILFHIMPISNTGATLSRF